VHTLEVVVRCQINHATGRGWGQVKVLDCSTRGHWIAGLGWVLPEGRLVPLPTGWCCRGSNCTEDRLGIAVPLERILILPKHASIPSSSSDRTAFKVWSIWHSLFMTQTRSPSVNLSEGNRSGSAATVIGSFCQMLFSSAPRPGEARRNSSWRRIGPADTWRRKTRNYKTKIFLMWRPSYYQPWRRQLLAP